MDHETHPIKWMISGISIPIKKGTMFWFFFKYPHMDVTTSRFYLGELIDISQFIGQYALVKIRRFSQYQDEPLILGDLESNYWIQQKDLDLTNHQKQLAQKALLRRPTYTIFISDDTY